MPSRESNVNHSRSIRHANMMNKRGCADLYHKPIHASKVSMKVKKVKSPKVKVVHENHGDTIIEGKPPKNDVKDEKRFTIPDVPDNQNIFLTRYLRSHVAMGLLNHELKTHFKVRTFSEDNDHEIEIL